MRVDRFATFSISNRFDINPVLPFHQSNMIIIIEQYAYVYAVYVYVESPYTYCTVHTIIKCMLARIYVRVQSTFYALI